MSSASVQLYAKSQEDEWLTAHPNQTYFEAQYPSREDNLRETLEVPFDYQNVTFGTTGRCTLPVKGDFLTRVTVRAILPPIYQTTPGTYVYPSTSTSFSGALSVQTTLNLVVADGLNLLATTTGSHFFSPGSDVILSGTAYSFFNLDGTYTISSVPSANSFVCSAGIAGISYNGTASSVGIRPAPVVGYYSTQNLNLWAEIPVNLPYTAIDGQLTDPVVSLVPEQNIDVFKSTGSSLLGVYTVATSSANTFTLVGQSVTGTLELVEQAITSAYDPTQNRFVFESAVYPSITFANAQDAAFWGFDYLQGPSFPFVNGVLTSQWTLIQGGWIQGFLPPSLSAYDDSVAHKLIKSARILVGKQTVKEFSGEYIELHNDLMVPYENKAILKLMNGTLDATQATVPREYYISLPLGFDKLPLCALKYQHVSVEIDFEEYQNLSNDLNNGSGNFFDPDSYLTYNVSQNILGGTDFNVSSTLSYQQYILMLTTQGVLIVYDTTKPIDASDSYNVYTAFAGQTSIFVNVIIVGNTLYIQLLSGYMISGPVDELIQGNASSFISNNYLPMNVSDAGPPTGTMVCDARYLYYAQTNVASNVFFVRYDTTTPFQQLDGYTSFNFTATIDPNVTSVYQIISTGNELIALTNTPGTFYVFSLYGNFSSEWTPISYGYDQVTEGVLIGTTVYFLWNNSDILVYSNGQFVPYFIETSLGPIQNLHAVGPIIYASANTSSTTSIIRLDTTHGLSASGAYQYYTSGNAPFSFVGPVPSIFANGPRFLYIFTSDPSQTTNPTNAIRYDPYTSTALLQTSLLVDYETGKTKPTSAILPIIQTQNVTAEQMNKMELHGPIKEVWFTGTPGVTNVYQYSNVTQSTFVLTAGEEIVTPDVGTHTSMNIIAPFEKHTSMPVRNVSIVSFEHDPERDVPNGTINFSRINEQQITGNVYSAWARNVNILTIQGGVGGLMFN